VGKVFFTNRDIGSTQAAIPVLKRLQDDGHTVITAASTSSPTFTALAEAGFSFIALGQYPRWDAFDGQIKMSALLRAESPDCVFVGVSASDGGSEKTAIEEAVRLGIPVVAFVESWPHGWLDQYGDRDIPIYRNVTKIAVMDEISRERLLAAGFTEDQVVVTGNSYDDTLMSSLAGRDQYRKEVRQHFGISDEAFVVTWMVGAELDNPLEDHEGAREWYGSKEADVLAEFLKLMQEGKLCYPSHEIEVIVRVKPSFSGETVQRLIKECCPSAHFDKVGHGGIPKPHLASDLVIGVKTLTLEQAAQLGIPAVSYIPNLPSPEVEPIANKLGVVLGIYERDVLAYLLAAVAADLDAALPWIKAGLKTTTPIQDATGNVAGVISAFFE